MYANVRKQILFSFFCSDMLTGFSVPVSKEKDVLDARALTQKLNPNRAVLQFNFTLEITPMAGGGSRSKYYFTSSQKGMTREETVEALTRFFTRVDQNHPVLKRFEQQLEIWRDTFHEPKT